MFLPEMSESADAILLCGGQGLRLKELTGDTPKSIYEIAGKPLIQYSLDHLVCQHIRRLIFALDDHAVEVREWVISREFPGQEIHFSTQSQPGIVEAVKEASSLVQKDIFVVCNTDEIQDKFNLGAFLEFHRGSHTLAATLAVYSNHLYRHRVLIARETDQLVLATDLENPTYRTCPEKIALVNGGLMIINKAGIKHFDPNYSAGWSGIIDPLCEAGQLSAFVAPEVVYFNVDTPEIYFEAQAYLQQSGQS
ncbi:hypothetical protein A3B42_02015 [Candidatus Daviesbacteria bacterium RIFCSPLOWO2_01_FULL_38_10]|uniref:HddC n=1 Tax=Candidatus Daviesbacteria bacterium GW2011_GWF2_38_6 TaxID=1618432 RepID=A0A0G0KR03_9BACT|nr:MAG: HddC [Candidatus Daviesbacteria bacterium GW2011_GWF2_38_6]OGE27975.1 MAG: hypothetical protein A3D02_04055 [Candidatus Daviesbacteria bacterium RIFCSPHIGHO2_02_FULL_39_41]OGE37489.1 MAG: hypothetical protein A3B42_02015 [Candidatus Daviesbacteria bacterium RIFCSPLOWO2_01_FULL_38_10]OGE68524.1 MAG: hypothetical protein A3H81_02215 [Candidatus Daviesbacteria bacterium RIFCSPLOWO2_02_FULL_38_18]OGE72495.1 MAG: hypothetical protein A3H18_03035 [Candidatus Daviesbacteria bacterium RIFCSPLOW